MTKPDDGGPAFPNGLYAHGMTLRDYFAGQTLAAAPYILRTFTTVGDVDADTRLWAKALYQVADAMLAARKVAKP